MERRGIALRIRAGDLAAMFEAYVIAVALGALKTAFDTTGPWYLATATFWTYFASFLGGLVLLGTLALSALVMARTKLPENPWTVSTPSRGTVEPRNAERMADEMKRLFQHLEPTPGYGNRAKDAAATLADPGAGEVAHTRPAPTVPGRHPGHVIFATLVGPTVAAALFAAVSAALLPDGSASSCHA